MSNEVEALGIFLIGFGFGLFSNFDTLSLIGGTVISLSGIFMIYMARSSLNQRSKKE